MKRACFSGLLAATLAAGPAVAQSHVRLEMAAAPLGKNSAQAVAAHPSPYNFPGIQFPRIEAGITNSYVCISPGTSHEWQTWRRSLFIFSQMLFK